jgi:transporter family protein
MNWWIWSLLTLALWSVWGALTKVALINWDWRQVFILGGVLGVVFALALALVTRPPLAMPLPTWIWPVLAISAGTAGTVTFYLALQSGRAAIIIPLTAAYPVVTVFLSVIFLREPLRLHEIAAIVLFVIATILVTR